MAPGILEFAQSYTPGMSGLDRFIAFNKGDVIGRDGAAREQESGPPQRLVLLEVEATMPTRLDSSRSGWAIAAWDS